MDEAAGRRAVITNVWPEIDAGRHHAKAVVGEVFQVQADVIADGEARVACEVLWSAEGDDEPRRAPMTLMANDRWEGQFVPPRVGVHRYRVRARTDPWARWTSDLAKRIAAGEDVSAELPVGAEILDAHASRLGAEPDRAALRSIASALRAGENAIADPLRAAEASRLVAESGDWSAATEYGPLSLYAEAALAGCSSWYELFPRSLRPDGRGTLRDVEAILPEIADLGFDVLYLPPIHPIGRLARKGPNNVAPARPEDPGSPWAIGSVEGGHLAIHPDLGTLADLRDLVAAARRHGLELALDVALHCAPDHPWVSEHPDWFRRHPDGTIRHMENPPHHYEDIVPFDFESAAWRELWRGLRGIFLYWAEQGVRVFRVDNPHTKPLGFWEWLIGELRGSAPDAILLAEAFTRPKLMYELAKRGFSQSYTYFTWRETPAQLSAYFGELSDPRVRQMFRPNLWPNTPDVLPRHLQTGGPNAFATRGVLAATLASSYGVYGPAFEVAEGRPLAPGGEEYLDSEKFQARAWDRAAAAPLRDLLKRLNAIRRAHPALRRDRGVGFHPVDGEDLLAFSRATDDFSDVILVVASTEPRETRAGWIDAQTDLLGLPAGARFTVTDLLGGDRYEWHAGRNYVSLDPHHRPAHVFRVEPSGEAEQG